MFGRAAVCDYGTPCTFLLPPFLLPVDVSKICWMSCKQCRRCLRRLILVYTVCSGLSVTILSFITVTSEPFPLIQEEQLSVFGERMCTKLVNRLED